MSRGKKSILIIVIIAAAVILLYVSLSAHVDDYIIRFHNKTYSVIIDDASSRTEPERQILKKYSLSYPISSDKVGKVAKKLNQKERLYYVKNANFTEDIMIYKDKDSEFLYVIDSNLDK